MSEPVRADSFNALAGQLKSNLLPVGREQTMGAGGNLPFGRTANRGQQIGKWQHPWNLRPFWNEHVPLTAEEQVRMGRTEGAWCISVNPGFVNGFAPAIWMNTNLIPVDAKVFGNNYGKAELPRGPGVTETTQVLLTDNPAPFFKCTQFFNATSSFYQGGTYHDGNYPMFFKYMRVKEPEKISPFENFLNTITELDRGSPIPTVDYGIDTPTRGQQLLLDILGGNADIPGTVFQDVDFNYGPRDLYSCDIVLKIDRPKRVQQFLQDEFGIDRLAGFTIEAPQTDHLQAIVYLTSRWFPPDFVSFQEMILGLQPPDPGFDEQVIGRMYFVSPDYRDLGGPDASWMPFVEHTVFWNINYASLWIIDPFKTDQSLDYFKQIGAVLAGGSAFLIIGSYADMIEVQYDTIANVMNKTDVSGRFWNG